MGSLHRVHARAICERIIDANPELSLVPNRLGVTAAEIATLCPAAVRELFVSAVLRQVAAATRKKLDAHEFTKEASQDNHTRTYRTS